MTAVGAWTEVLAISPEEKEQVVYNFEVEENHDYFVGSAGLLVHNGNCSLVLTDQLQALVDQAAAKFEQVGFTPAQEARLASNPDLAPAFIGERIDLFARQIFRSSGLADQGYRNDSQRKFWSGFL